MLHSDYLPNENPKQVRLWDLNIEAVEGHDLQAGGRGGINKKLSQGWLLIHIYNVKYKDGEIWKEKPMAILGRPSGTYDGTKRTSASTFKS